MKGGCFIMNNLRKYRKLRGLTQTELASRVGLPFQTFISKCELGQKRLSYSLAVKLANVLDCDVYDLMGDDIFKKDVEDGANRDALQRLKVQPIPNHERKAVLPLSSANK